MHPALFHCLVLIDPVIYDESEGFQPGSHPAKLSARRKDIWASQEEAEEYFGSRPFYQRWDSRVLALHTVRFNFLPFSISVCLINVV